MSLMIQSIHGREIIDSRGNPTVEAVVLLQNGVSGTAAVPSGASTGQFEALELRDADPARFGGKGVLRAVKNINTEICAALTGMDASHTGAIDTAHASPGRYAGQIPAWRKRDFGGFSRQCPGRGKRAGPSPVPVFGRRQRRCTSCTDDEHSQRRRARSQ